MALPMNKKQNSVGSKDIGNFIENKVSEWIPISFAIEFIIQMRKNQKRLLNIPSTRQAISIPKLLTATYYRKKNLVHEDFLNAAVITTPIEDQEVARQIAFDILFPKKFLPKKSQGKSLKGTTISKFEDDTLSNGLDADNLLEDEEDIDFMDDLLSEISDLGLDIDDLDSSDILDQSINEMESITDFLDELYQKAEQKIEPYYSLLKILEQRNGFRDIMQNSINNLTDLKNFVHQTIMREINVLSPTDIKSGVNLGWGNEMMDQSKETPWIHTGTQFCMKHQDFQKNLSEVVKNEDAGTIARTIKYLNELGYGSQEIKKLIDEAVSKSHDLTDILEISKILEQLHKFDENKIFDNSLKRDQHMAFDISRGLDKKFDSNLTENLFDNFLRKNPQPSLPELFNAQTDNSKWRNSLDKSFDNEFNNIIQLKGNTGNPAADLSNLASQLLDYAKNAAYNSTKKEFQKKAEKCGMKSLDQSKDSDQFQNILNSILNAGIKPDKTEAIKIGRMKGVSEDRLIEIFGGTFEILKSMFEKKVGDFNRYQNIMSNLGSLSQQQMTDLIKCALSSNNNQALAAVGNYDLSIACQSAEGISGSYGLGVNALESLISSLTAGPGENLLLQWFYHRHNIPKKVKNLLRELTKNALINIALNIISNQRGTGDKGLYPVNELRIFLDGDDMELIDIDASIENIVMSGKSLDLITSDDLLVNKSEKGRVSICFLLDISGSMSGEKLAACSIAVMVLIGRLQTEEVAIALFESNTHVMKTFDDQKNLDDVADELLDLRATGGTMVSSALKWGNQQLLESDSDTKLLFLLTDCEFFEDNKAINKLLEKFVEQRTKFILAVNTKSYNKNMSGLILKTTKGQFIKILNVKDIPKIISETIEKIG